MAEFTPTKSNLIKVKSSLEFSEKGFELLDKKRNILIREMMELTDKAKEVQNKMYGVMEEAYSSLQVVNITMGIHEVEDIAHSISINESFEILLKSVMGVDIPVVKYEKSELYPTYGMHNTNAELDNAVNKFLEVRYMIYELAQIDNAIFRLAKEIEKTKKRANALEYIKIPRAKENIRYIQGVLEEKEREDFFRLKKTKKR